MTSAAPAHAGDLITARLLILQSKRLMLSSALRRAADGRRDAPGNRVRRLRDETERAQSRYEDAVLKWGSPESSNYWLIAYGRLIHMGNGLTQKLRSASAALPLSERVQVSADVEMLEDIVADWTASMRTTMVAGAG